MKNLEKVIELIDKRIAIAKKDLDNAYSDMEYDRAIGAKHELEDLLDEVKKSKNVSEVIQLIKNRIAIAEKDAENFYSDLEYDRAFGAKHDLEELLLDVEKLN